MANPEDLDPADTTDLDDDPAPEGYEAEPEDEPEPEPEGDEPEPEAEPEPDPDPADPPPAAATAPSRARDRLQRQQRENERLRTETATLKARLELQEQQSRQAQAAAQQQRNADYLASLDPADRAVVLNDQRFQQLQQQINRQSLDLQENADRTAWTSKTAADPLAKTYEVRVEKRLMELRSQGQNVPRENIYKFLIGEDIATKGPKAVLQQRTAAARRVTAASGEPPRARGNASAGRSSGRADPDSMEALEARLKNARF